ncbi:MAG TPA: NUDIX domain-containing protein [Candidatus Paceibacterota bacterium]
MAEEQKVEKKRVGAGFGVILLRDGKILMGKRHPDPDKADSAFRSAGEWSLPGGKLDWRESIEEGAIREVKEETDIDIKNPEVISVHNCKNEHAHFLTVGLVAKDWTGEAKVMEPDEMTEWDWFPLDNLPSPRYFPSFEVIDNYLAKKFYIKRPAPLISR